MSGERIVSHLREGLSASVSRQAGASGLRATLAVDLAVDGLPLPLRVPELALAGPGDVARLDAAQITRQFPAPDSRDAPADLFAFVEFARGNLPWLFSPFGPGANGTIRPWLALVVLEAATVRLRPGQPNDVIEVAPADLPEPGRIEAWAHAQFAVADGPSGARSRLLCPRRLSAETDYLACVVPSFRAGVLTGLGQALTGTDAELLGPAWTTTGAGPVTLPVYRHWSFRTGENGSFGALVRRLSPALPQPQIGTRQVDVTAPGGGMAQTSSPRRIPLDGALVPLGTRGAAADSGFRRRILPLLDRPDTLSPPSYGLWHAGQKPTASGRRVAWIKSLNLDPRRRIAAALGTEVVQRHQDTFMAAIWAQAGEVEAANRDRRFGQMSLATAQSLTVRRLWRRLETEDLSLLLFAAPSLARIPYRDMLSLRGLLAQTCLGLETLGAPLQRLLRGNGPVQRRISRASDGLRVAPGAVLQDLLDGALRDKPGPPSGARVRSLASLAPTRLPRTPPFRAGPVIPRTPLARALHDLSDLVRQSGQPACNALPSDTIPVLRSALDPALTLPRRVRARSEITAGLTVADSGLEPILVAPRLPMATAPYLIELSPDWLLPGVGEADPDSITAFVPNPSFIEAFFVGMNHEIAREMLWRGFPTDQRGTVFDSFWANDDRAIPPIHGWRRALGRQASGRAASGTVLLLRGELVRRFPDVGVFLQPAVRVGGQWLPDPIVGPSRSLAPGFVRTLSADQRLFGFGLSPTTLRGQEPAAPGGYFLVFQEPAQALRFGPPSQAQYAPNGYLDLNGTPVQLADALRRQTARYHVHASRFLSP